MFALQAVLDSYLSLEKSQSRRLVEQAAESNKKYTVNCIFVKKIQHDYTLYCYIKNMCFCILM